MTIERKCYFGRSSKISYLTIILIFILLCHSREVSAGILSGAGFCARCLIPTLFPFFIISDMIISFGLPLNGHLRKRGLDIILVGLICGFPHGARCATRLFEDGRITKGEYERLLVLSNSPSPAFIISGVGSGMLGDARLGAILFFALLSSVMILALLFRHKEVSANDTTPTFGRDFSLVESIKSAGQSSITIASFVIFFYGVNSLITLPFKDNALKILIGPIMEIGSGCAIIASSVTLPLISKMALLGFAIGFSSLSVFMQCSAFISKSVSRKKLFFFKVLQGVLVSLIAFLLTFIYKKWLFS